jgi:hypothetical protein
MSDYNEYCHSCGVGIGEPSAFCSNCGAVLVEPDTVSAPSGAHEHTASEVPRSSLPPDAHRAPPPRPEILGSGPSVQARPPTGTPPPATTSDPGAGTPGRPHRWLPIAALAGAAVLVTGVVVIVLLALGGSAGRDVKGASATRNQALQLLAANGTTTVSRAAPGLFAVVKTGNLSALVPAGWQATAQAASGTARAEFADPKHSSSTLTIVAQAGAGNEHKSALAARSAAQSKGYAESSFGRIAFPGGRGAWHLTYAKSGVTHETYFYSACGGHDTLVVDTSAASTAFPTAQATLQAAAAGAEPLC